MNTEALKQAEHALRQANRAAKKGDLAAAERWSKTAERIAATVETLGAARDAEVELARVSQEQAEEMACDFFTKVAYVANAMVHAPNMAPAAFQGLVKLWREQNLGEGEADAERAAAKRAAAEAAYLNGEFEASLPDYVRERMKTAWNERREALKQEPVVPLVWE